MSQPLPLQMQEEIQLLLEQSTVWKGRPLEGKVSIRTLHSDSSDIMWAGVDLKTGEKIQEYWRTKTALHITAKELLAAVETVKSLAKKGGKVELIVENQVAY